VTVLEVIEVLGMIIIFINGSRPGTINNQLRTGTDKGNLTV
jgi:hypothetical protein